jgi:hypothetical protein
VLKISGLLAMSLCLFAVLASTTACHRNEVEGPAANGTASPPAPTATVPYGQATWSRYEDKKIGFAVSYPVTWSLPDFEMPLGVPEKVIAMARLTNNWNDFVMLDVLTLYVYGLEFEASDEAMDQLLLERDGAYDRVAVGMGGGITEKGWTDFGGRRARYWVADSWIGMQPLRVEYVVTFRGNQQYEALCQAKRQDFAEFFGGCRAILDSFEFLPLAAN